MAAADDEADAAVEAAEDNNMITRSGLAPLYFQGLVRLDWISRFRVKSKFSTFLDLIPELSPG